MLEWPRSAFMPPPRMPILPSMSCSIAMVRMFCEPLLMLRPAERVHRRHGLVGRRRLGDHLATLRNLSFGVPQMRSTISGV